MLAQLFLTPFGMMLDAALVVPAATEAAASVAVEAHPSGFSVSELSSAGLGASELGESPVVAAAAVVSQSGAGVEVSTLSLREPFVCATAAPRPLPPLPRSPPRPRPPLLPSKPPRPPREGLD